MHHDDRVIVGYDGTGHGMAAVEWAAREAAEREAPLHVVSIAGHAGTTSGALSGRVTQAMAAASEDHMEDGRRMAAKVLGETTVTGEVVIGHPAGVLVEASRHSALVVLGQRSHGAAEASAVGSTSVTVAANALGPVVIVRGASDGRSHDRPVVVGATGHSATDNALAFAAEAALRRQVPLTIVSAWALPATSYWRYQPEAAGSVASWSRDLARGAAAAARYSEDLVRARWRGVTVDSDVVSLQPWAALEAASRRASLLVVGARGGGGFPGLGLGSVSRSCLFHSGCPVAVVP